MAKRINAEELFIGKEPIWWEKELPIDANIDTLIGDSFNYYNYRYSPKDSYEFIKKYVSLNYSKENVHKFNSLKEWEVSPTLGWISRMLSLGCDKFPPDMIERFYAGIEKCFKKYRPTEKVTESPKYVEKTYLYPFEEIIDSYITHFNFPERVAELKKISLEKKHAVEVQKYYQGLFEELSFVIHGNVENISQDEYEQLEEAYSCYTKEQLSSFFVLVQTILEICAETTTVKKVVKEIPFHKKLAKLQPLKEIPELEIKSLTLNKLFDPMMNIFVFYNNASKKIIIAHKEKDGKLDISGKLITGFSQCYVLKSKTPEAHVKLFYCSSKSGLNKLLKEFRKSKPLETFKINSNTLFLKSF